jgi:hypothetical protein
MIGKRKNFKRIRRKIKIRRNKKIIIVRRIRKKKIIIIRRRIKIKRMRKYLIQYEKKSSYQKRETVSVNKNRV